ncbi:MAG: tRNA (cytidine(56)-2'-O)-methyltransferase [Thermoplasmata archaeon]|nr:tRNA (cytidine(56)-2'-O)-methyltransferase [Thermoplasmata archaeon]MCI4359451.1 tRNA (cytidine(56)-2'-O)-methyltransferase [Thermoplasmata archaeon]
MPLRRDRSPPAVEVLRLGHRAGRDPRLTTHLALTARAFGAERMWLNPPDPALADRIHSLAQRWGGRFAIEGCSDWKRAVREFDGTTVHLTMYGRPVERVIDSLRRRPRILVVVGGAKVPAPMFSMASENVAIGHQPHSEVAALAVFLSRLLGSPGPRAWQGARQRIVPSARGKRVRTVG